MCTALRNTIHNRGYRQINEWLGGLLDFLLALIFLFPALVIMGVCCVLYKIFNWNRGSVIYTGARLGKNRRVFQMYKIRTLAEGTDAQFANEILSPGSGKELRFGRFFRRTRLDELPQIINILKGDMSFVGPRPMRPAIYEKFKDAIPNYDNRFMVKPGLIGYAQLCTPHSAPSRIRALIDNRYVRVRRSILWDLVLIAMTGAFLIKNFLAELALTVRDYGVILTRGRRGRDLRKVRRLKPKHIRVCISDTEFVPLGGIQVILEDINHEALRVRSNADWELDEEVYLRMEIDDLRKGKTKPARAKAFVYRKREAADNDGMRWDYVLFYAPVSLLNRYVVDQYILRQSIVNIF